MNYIRQGTRLILQTIPYILLRILSLFLLVLIIGGLGFLFISYDLRSGNIGPSLNKQLFLIALPLFIIILGGSTLGYYGFFLLKAAHIAVMMELLQRGKLPNGSGQLSWGYQQVRERFKNTSALFLLRGRIKSSIKKTHRLQNNSNLGFSFFSVFAGPLLNLAAQHIDEAILARAYTVPPEQMWNAAKDGVVLYMMAWKPLVKSAMLISLITIGSVLVLLLIYAIPFFIYMSRLTLPLQTRFLYIMIFIVSLPLTFILFKVAIADNLPVATMLAIFYDKTKNLTPDNNFEFTLQQASGNFRALQKAAGQDPVLPPQIATQQLKHTLKRIQPEPSGINSGPYYPTIYSALPAENPPLVSPVPPPVNTPVPPSESGNIPRQPGAYNPGQPYTQPGTYNPGSNPPVHQPGAYHPHKISPPPSPSDEIK